MRVAEMAGRSAWWLGLGTLLLFAGYMGFLDARRSLAERLAGFQFLYGLAFLGYVWIVYARLIVQRRDQPFELLAVLLAGVVLRLLIFVGPTSDELHRYVWEGQIQLERWNPYAVRPDDAVVAHLRDERWGAIQDRHTTTRQGPFAQMVFAAAAWVYPAQGTVKAAVAAFDVLTMLAAAAWARNVRGMAGSVVIYAFSPLVLAAFAMEGRTDSFMLAWLALAGWASTRRRWAACGICLGLAALSGGVALILLPWALGRSPRAFWLSLAVVILGYLPYSAAGPGLAAGLWDVTAGPMLGSFGPALLRPITGPWSATVGCLAVAVFYACWLAVAARLELHEYALRVFGALILLLPVVHYWFVAWVLLLTVLHVQWRWIVLSGSMVFYFDLFRGATEGEAPSLPPGSHLMIWAPFVVAWLTEVGWDRWIRSRRRLLSWQDPFPPP